ncbi:MAG TPA: hypothetical protein VHE83_16470 [Mycobacteriales bacterium]|nr:hypothetical protein [Mycobacteriales bacterium]
MASALPAALRSEVLKARTTPTALGLAAATVGLSVLAVLLHAVGLPASELSTHANQQRVLVEAGENIGAVFAALLGALAMTAEFRHGTIRPTFLSTPRRTTVVTAKALLSLAGGAMFGLLATATSSLAGAIAFSSRGLASHLDGTDYLRAIVGGTAAASLWALIGLAVGAIVRNQVGATAGLFVWLLIVENLLVDGAPSVSKVLPGSLGQALAGQRTGTLHAAVGASLLLIAYAAVALALATRLTVRRDVT